MAESIEGTAIPGEVRAASNSYEAGNEADFEARRAEGSILSPAEIA